MFVALADKVINTTSKEENKIITDNVKKNRDNIYEQDDFSKNIMQLAYKRGDLLDAVKIILEFNEVLSQMVNGRFKKQLQALCKETFTKNTNKYAISYANNKKNRFHYDDFIIIEVFN